MYETITTNIMVNNVKESIEYYKTILEFDIVLTVPENADTLDFAIMKKDSISIMFQSKKSLMEEYETLQVDQIKPTFTLFITVKDVEKLYNQLKSKTKIAKELHKTFYGKDEFAIFDNNGNILTISC